MRAWHLSCRKECLSIIGCTFGVVTPNGSCAPSGGTDSGEPHPNDSGSDSGGDSSSDAAVADASDAPVFVPPNDAGSSSCIATDPAHDNASPGTAIHSPLTVAWTVDLGGPPSAPVVADGLIIVTSSTPTSVLALDPASGATVWGPISMGASMLGGNGLFVAAEGDRVFALNGGGVLVALDAKTGSQLWSSVLEEQSFYQSPPVAAGGLVFVNGLGEGGTTVAVDASNGSVVWTAGTFDGRGGAVAVAQGVVYEAEACDQLSAFEAVSGRLLWYHAGTCTGGGGAAPAVFGDHIWERDGASGDVIFDTAGKVTGSFDAQVMPSFGGGAPSSIWHHRPCLGSTSRLQSWAGPSRATAR